MFGIVKQSGGHIGSTASLDGTSFKLCLPRTDRTADIVTLSRPPAPLTLRGSETILLAEDEESVRVVIRTILRRNGYNVLEARLSGRQLAERLLAVGPDLKVLSASGYTDAAIVHHGVLDAGVAFLQKPITPDGLLRKVRTVLDTPAPKSPPSA